MWFTDFAASAAEMTSNIIIIVPVSMPKSSRNIRFLVHTASAAEMGAETGCYAVG